jgi:hypothetical protein
VKLVEEAVAAAGAARKVEGLGDDAQGARENVDGGEPCDAPSASQR